MSDTNPTPVDISESNIEQVAKVYLVWDVATQGWVIDPLSLKGPLDSNYSGVDIDLNSDYWTDTLRAEMERATQAGLPTAEELFMLLWKAMPADSTVGAAISKIADAASNWADELATDIADGSDAYGSDEDAQGQRDASQEINDALELLND